VGIQANLGSLYDNCCTSQVVYGIYARGAKRDSTPIERMQEVIKDFKGAKNAEV